MTGGNARLLWAGTVALLLTVSCDFSFPLAPAMDPRLDVEIEIVEADGVLVGLEAAFNPGRTADGRLRSVTDPSLTAGPWTVLPNDLSSDGVALYEATRVFEPVDSASSETFLNGIAAGPLLPPSVAGVPSLPGEPIVVLRRQGDYVLDLLPTQDLTLRTVLANRPDDHDEGGWSLEVVAEDALPLVSVTGTGPPADSIVLPRNLLGACIPGPYTARLNYRIVGGELGGPGIGILQRVDVAVEWHLTRACGE